MGEPTRSALLRIPNRIAGRYELLAKIASGGMATVFLARATTSVGVGKLVALKCVHPHLADQADFVNMFLDEARIVTRIDHPNVATVFDAGADHDIHYLAMEYLHGEPLTALLEEWSRVDERPPGFCELVARIIADAAMGLHAAHELTGAGGRPLGLVHRDVSPHNLFVTFDGSVKVVDFGIAQAAGRLHETTTGVVKGKVPYMSPEQLNAQPLDRRTDVWALGVTLWELLTCERLFKRADQVATLHAVLEQQISAPSSRESRVPRELDAIVLKALHRDREGRYATARELADALNGFIAARGVHVGIAELADALATTFPELKRQKDQWIERVRESSAEPRTQAVAPARAAGESTRAMRASEPTISAVRRTESDGIPRAAAASPTESVHLPVRQTSRWVLSVVALLAGAGVTYAGWVALHEGPTPPTTPTPVGSTTTPTVLEPRPASTLVESRPASTLAEPRPASTLVEPSPIDDAPPDPTASAADSSRSDPTPRRTRSSRRGVAPASDRAPAATPSHVVTTVSRRDIRIVHPGGGWAALEVDGHHEGNTPTTLRALSVGRHTIALQPYGTGASIRRELDVPEGDAPYVLRVPLPNP